MTITGKKEKLDSILRESGGLVVAYSGGVDSAFLLHAAVAALGGRCRGVIADSPSLPRHELAEAVALAHARGWALDIVQTGELENPDYAANPVNRCYYCKHELFDRLSAYAREHRIATLAYGENADDANEERPGQKAASEFRVLAPLREAGLDKAEIRQLSEEAGLPTAAKAAQPCLASRLPHGRPVTVEALAQVERGETALRDAGFHIFRLRHEGARARIQVAPVELPRLADMALRASLSASLKEIGFAEIEFDPDGYRGASLR